MQEAIDLKFFSFSQLNHLTDDKKRNTSEYSTVRIRRPDLANTKMRRCGRLGCMRPRHWILRIVVLSFILWSGPNSSSAQQRPTLSGTVIDSNSTSPISGAVVILAGTLHGALTDNDGRFQFATILPGKYLLSVFAEGYDTIQKSIEIQEDMELVLLISPVGYELPDRHGFPSPNSQTFSNLFRSLLPRRVNALRVLYTPIESEFNINSYYMEGLRLIYPFTPFLTLTESDRTEIIPGPYSLDHGLDATIQYKTSEQSTSGVELIYDSKQRGLISRGTLERDWSGGYGILSASYSGAGDYLDGSGLVQQAGLRSGNIAGRVGVRLDPNQAITGSAGWLQDLSHAGEEFLQRSAFFQYRYSNKTGFLQGVTASFAVQGLEHEIAERQQGGSVSVRLMPWSNLRLHIGSDYYHHTFSEKSHHRMKEENYPDSSLDTGVFMTVLQRVSQFLIDVQYRLDSHNNQWGGSTSVTWQFGNEWKLLAGAGRVRSSGSAGMLRQINLGIRWEGLSEVIEFMTFSRETENNHSFGVTSLFQRAWWSAMTYTAVSNLSSSDLKPCWSTWGQVQVVVQGPFNLFKFGSDLYGTIFNEPAWISTDIWLQIREFNGISLQIRTNNLLDGTFRYPYSEFAEPGRSVVFSLRYQHK